MSSGGNAPEVSDIGSQGGISSDERHPVRPLKGVDGAKYSARRIAARVLFASGAIAAYRRLALWNRAIVLTYHRIMPREEGESKAFEGIRVAPGTFEHQMAYLRKHFHLLALDDLLRHLRNRSPFPPNSCLVTFDDGWRDNYIHAYPALNRYEIPAVVFLTVGHIGTRKRFWQDRTFAILDGIREAAKRTPGLPLRYRNLPGGMKVEELVAWPERKFREEVRKQIHSLKKLPLSRIEPILNEIGATAGMTGGPTSDGDPFLSWEEIEEMHRGGIDFGSHGMSHDILTNITPDEVRKEALESRQIIEKRIQKSVYAFSYPNGDHDPAVKKCIGECGYEIAFGTSRGFTGAEDDRFSVKRVNVNDDVTREIPMFLSSILGMI